MSDRELKDWIDSLKARGIIRRFDPAGEDYEEEIAELDAEYAELVPEPQPPPKPPLLNPFESEADRILTEIKEERERQENPNLLPYGVWGA